MQNTQKPTNKANFSLKMHLIFVVKYRKKLLLGQLDLDMKQIMSSVTTKDFSFIIMETDMDHIHLMVDYSPNVSVAQIVRHLKQLSTYRIWQLHNLSSYFWKERTFWSNGYFVASIGNASEETIRKYIEEQ